MPKQTEKQNNKQNKARAAPGAVSTEQRERARQMRIANNKAKGD